MIGKEYILGEERYEVVSRNEETGMYIIKNVENPLELGEVSEETLSGWKHYEPHND